MQTTLQNGLKVEVHHRAQGWTVEGLRLLHLKGTYRMDLSRNAHHCVDVTRYDPSGRTVIVPRLGKNSFKALLTLAQEAVTHYCTAA